MKTQKLHEKALDALRKRNYDYAVDLFQQVLQLDPNDVEARKQIRETVIKDAQENGTAIGGPMAYVKGLGPLFKLLLFGAIKKNEECAIAAEQFLVHDPANALALTKLGGALFREGYNEGAIATFEWLLQVKKNHLTALRFLGRLYQATGDLKKASYYYERVRQVNPTDAEAAKAVRDLAAAGATSQITKAHAEGEGSYRDVIKDKEKASELEAKQHILRTDEDFDRAIEAARKAVEAAPGNSKLYRNLGDVYEKRGDLKNAGAAYQKALEVSPDDHFASDSLGDVKLKHYENVAKQAQKAGDQVKAKEALAAWVKFGVEDFRRRTDQYPTDLNIRFRYGSFLMRARQYDDAIAEFQEAIRDPRHGMEARVAMAQCFKAKGNFDAALKQLESARDGQTGMGGRMKDITFEIGLVHEARGDRAKALEEFNRVYEVDIKFRDVAKKVEELSGK
ncbi:MAG: tetratricopeptide repeat protein [Planctomycetes bacterium]|nr:tetratricopeptide repeat protein [Planctomycetota bacterium]